MNYFKHSLLYCIILIFFGSIYFISNMRAMNPINPLSTQTAQNAGILPWTFHDNTIWVMIGLERRARAGWVWTDFGGKCDMNKNTGNRETIAECAGREGSEEIRELYTPAEFAQKIAHNPIIITSGYAQCFPDIAWISQKDLNTLAKQKTGTHWEKPAFKWIGARELMHAIDQAKATGNPSWFYNVDIAHPHYDNTTQQTTLLYWNLAKTLDMPQTRKLIADLLAYAKTLERQKVPQRPKVPQTNLPDKLIDFKNALRAFNSALRK
jgi:hypothetical protein